VRKPLLILIPVVFRIDKEDDRRISKEEFLACKKAMEKVKTTFYLFFTYTGKRCMYSCFCSGLAQLRTLRQNLGK
jgi:hypothetical protein